MFEKILIANRGEIACRIIRSCQRLGVRSVAVYSRADADALHVDLADEAVEIGPAPAAESYLVIDRIVAACKQTGAQAVHPGFGFLAENPAFVEALVAAGIVFIGPPTAAIAAMGDKIESKRLAAAAGVSTVPGHMALIPDAEAAVAIAREIGYPVMIKASAGGGGKGMRVAWNDQEALSGFASARNEARASFADERIFIETFIEQPRHIEIQVLADGHGTVLHLGERECSIQRRHQKVIEEAPSPFLDPATREAMGAQAVALAAAVDYRSAGTVEFIADQEKRFYFLEMNTRIQVEHPVTEMVCGLDIVEWMIRIAAGEPLGFGQDDVRLDGWAIEARVYAEDPVRNFLPSIGRLVRYREPAGSAATGAATGIEAQPGVPAAARLRIDSGVVEGSEISVYYDPMIAKVIAHGETRADAIAELRAALDAFHIKGISHNIAFLAAVLAHDRFRAGRLSTNFIAEVFPDGFHGRALDAPERGTLIAVAVFVQRRLAERELTVGGQLDGHEAVAGEDWVVLVDGDGETRRIAPIDGGYRISGAAGDVTVESDWRLGDALFRGRVAVQPVTWLPVTVQLARRGPAWRLTHGGTTLEALVLRPRAAALARLMPIKQPPDRSKILLSPMPGLLVSIAVEVGQEIRAGEELAVVEAMKMENVLRAERDGVVATLHAAPGDSLAVDQAILEFD